LDNLHFRQAEWAPTLLPFFQLLKLFDALAARQHAAGPLQRILAAQAFINRHWHTCLVYNWSVRITRLMIKTRLQSDKSRWKTSVRAATIGLRKAAGSLD